MHLPCSKPASIRGHSIKSTLEPLAKLQSKGSTSSNWTALRLLRSNYEFLNQNNFNIRYWSLNYRGCGCISPIVYSRNCLERTKGPGWSCWFWLGMSNTISTGPGEKMSSIRQELWPWEQFQISFHSCQAFSNYFKFPSTLVGLFIIPKHYKHWTVWKDKLDPSRTVAVRTISNFLPLLSGFF